MNFFNIIEHIKVHLNTNGFPNLAEEILEVQLSGGIGGETLIMVCSKLLEIKRKNKKAYSIIESDTKILINYANNIGLFPR